MQYQERLALYQVGKLVLQCPELNSVISGMSNVVSSVTSGVSRAVSAARSFIGHMVSVGRDLIMGLINGIKAMAGQVASAAKM